MDDNDNDNEIQEIEEPKARRASVFVFYFFLLAFPCPHCSSFTAIKGQLWTRSTSRLSNVTCEFISHVRACLVPYHLLYTMQQKSRHPLHLYCFQAGQHDRPRHQ